MKLYLRLLKYVRPYTKRIIIALVCMTIVSSCTVGLMYILKPVFDKIFANPNKEEALMFIKIIPLALLGLFFIKGLAYYAQDYLINNTGQRVIMDIRNLLYEHLQYMSISFYHNQKTGHLISRITNDVSIMQNAVSGIVGSVASNGLTLIGLIILIFKLNWQMAIIALFVFPIAIYPLYKFGAKIRKISSKSQAKTADISAILYETISGIRVVKGFGMEKAEIDKFKKENRNFFDISMKSLKITAMSSPIMEFIGGLGISFLIAFSGRQVVSGQLSIGGFTAFVATLLSLYKPLHNLNGINQTLQQSLAAAERVFNLMDVPPEEDNGTINIEPVKNSIIFENVNFSYDGKKDVLESINLSINAGEVIAIVGPSGYGKTTLVNLLLRFYNPTKGSIKIDDIDVQKVTLKSLRAQMGIVTQETILFNDTFRNNIAYGNPITTDSAVEFAACAANAHDFIIETTYGYDTFIGERGAKISGGEKQRIAIARAILKNPPILILDEATSALDNESEKLVQDALNNLMKNRTTFVIAHRLSTVMKADKIVVIDDGKIADVGKHEELMTKGGLYKKLYEMQFKM
mgnify:FL=1